MKTPALLTLLPLAAQALDALSHGNGPADRQLDAFFRSHPRLGGRDRGFIAETVYGCLRHRRLLETLGADISVTLSPAMRQVVIHALLWQGASGRALTEAGLPAAEIEWLTARVRTLDRSTLPVAVQVSLPDWLHDKLVAQFGADEARALAEALNLPAPLDLRVNTLKADRDAARERLATEGFPSELTPLSPVGLRRRERKPLFRTASFQEGWIEVQDEGSQLVSLLVEARRGEMVADFCAGAGGKTLHLGALMGNRGTLYAFDVSAKRLAQLKPRLARAGLDNVRMVAIAHEKDERVRRLAGKIDRVLVDAPCSGTGTLRRNPDLKWRDTDLAALAENQLRILTAAATLVKPGGRLVYATCSLLREENDDVVEKFLAGNTVFRQAPVTEILARRQVALTAAEPALRLLPHRHHCDGFFAAVLERNPAKDAS